MKCKNCGREVDDKTVFCPFCHKNTFSESNFENEQIKNVKRINTKRIVSISCVSALCVIFIIVLVVNIITAKHIPAGMSEQTYNAVVKTIEITDDYLDFNITKDIAYTQISEIEDRIDNEDNLSVSIYVSAITWDLVSNNKNDTDILIDRNKLADVIDINKK